MGEKIFTLLLEIVVGVMEAQYQHGALKKQTLLSASPKLNTVKILVRMTRSIEIIDEREYLWMENELNEMGKMLGGWIKSV